MRDPSVVLTAPQAEPLIPENLNAALHLSDLISIGWWANWILKSATEVDVYGEFGSWFAGDWAEVSRSGDALAKLGDFCTASCEALRAEARALESGWSGSGGTEAKVYLQHLASALDGQSAQFARLGHDYQQAATGVKGMADCVGGLVNELVDWAIIGGIAAAAGAATAETGIGALIGGAGVGVSIYKVWRIVSEILEWHGRVMIAVDGTLGLMAGTLSTLKGFSAVDLPTASIDVEHGPHGKPMR